MNRYPKVLVGCPTCNLYAYCLDEFKKTVDGFDYPNYEVWLVDNSKDDVYFEKLKKLGFNVIKDKWMDNARDRIVRSRNILRQKVLDEGFDYFFSLEQDVMPVTKDIIQRLMRHKKKVISGIYFSPKENKEGKVKLYAVMFNWVDPKNRDLYPEKAADIPKELIDKKKGLFAIKSCGLGCLLIDKTVLDKIKFRYVPEVDSFDDIHFSRDVRELGEVIFADTTALCQHRFNKPWKWNDLKM